MSCCTLHHLVVCTVKCVNTTEGSRNTSPFQSHSSHRLVLSRTANSSPLGILGWWPPEEGFNHDVWIKKVERKSHSFILSSDVQTTLILYCPSPSGCAPPIYIIPPAYKVGRSIYSSLKSHLMMTVYLSLRILRALDSGTEPESPNPRWWYCNLLWICSFNYFGLGNAFTTTLASYCRTLIQQTHPSCPP